MGRIDGHGTEFTDHAGYRFNVVALRAIGQVQIWFKPPGDQKWHFGHSKDIPVGMTEREAVDIVRWYLLRKINHETYTRLLPKGEG